MLALGRIASSSRDEGGANTRLDLGIYPRARPVPASSPGQHHPRELAGWITDWIENQTDIAGEVTPEETAKALGVRRLWEVVHETDRPGWAEPP